MSIKIKIILVAFSVLTMSLISSCTYDNQEELFTDNDCKNLAEVSLQNDVQPILQSNCLGCHNTVDAFGGIDLENYQSLKGVAESGLLLGAINHDNGFTNMPPSGTKLDDCSIEKIKVWIAEGALEN